MCAYTTGYGPWAPCAFTPQVMLSSAGQVLDQRVQAQTFWPLGVDNAFSYSGSVAYLKKMLPLVDLSLDWCASRYDTDGLFLCHEEASKGKEGSDCGGPGMDWVDWSESRASGKTFNFDLWHAFTLKRLYLHCCLQAWSCAPA